MLQDSLTRTNVLTLESEANALGMDFAFLEASVTPLLPKDDSDKSYDSDELPYDSDDDKTLNEFKTEPVTKKRRITCKSQDFVRQKSFEHSSHGF